MSVSQDCRTQDQECTCPELSSGCRCGLNGRCRPDGTCHAAECVTLGLKECPCLNKTSGDGLFQTGVTVDETKCGICCTMAVDGINQCVTADDAARYRLSNDIPLPDDWPDRDYRGPNMSVHLCEGYVCNQSWVRAWPVGSVCVTQNTVGVCSPKGVCEMDYSNPRSNVYPDIMNIRLMGHKRNSCRSLKTTSIILISLVLLVSVIK